MAITGHVVFFKKLKALREDVTKITDSKLVSSSTDAALRLAKEAWERYGGFVLDSDLDDPGRPEGRFWWRLLAYRYANLVMRRADSLEDLRLAERLFKCSTGLGGSTSVSVQDRPKEVDFSRDPGFRELAFISKVYRIAVIRRILGHVDLQPDESKRFEDESNQTWDRLKQDLRHFEARGIGRRAAQTDFHNLLELTCYFTGMEYGEGIEGTGVYFGIPGVGNPGYRLIDNRGAFSDTLYPFEIAKYVASQLPDAFAYELTNYTEETSNRIFGKWLNPNYDRPPVHCLALLTYSLLYPAARRFPNEDNTRHVRTEFKRMIQAITGISSIEWQRGCAPNFVRHPNHFIGIVNSKTVEWAEEMCEKPDEGKKLRFGREMPREKK